MSSILQALKKIETDSTPQEELTTWSKNIDTKTAINSGARKRWYYRKLVSLFWVGLVILAIGVLFFTQWEFVSSRILAVIRPAAQEASSQTSGSNGTRVFRAKIDADQIPKAIATPVDAAVKTSDRTKDNQRLSAQHRPPRRVPPVNRTQTGAQSKTVPVKKSPPKTSAKKISPKKPSRQPTLSTLKARRKPETRSSKTSIAKKKAAAAPKKEIEYDRLADADFKLQAIAWSRESAKRLAVINGRIIREGDSVGDYTVTQIRQEDVIVNDGSKTWLLEFGLKQ